jgi:hypothetical protein
MVYTAPAPGTALLTSPPVCREAPLTPTPCAKAPPLGQRPSACDGRPAAASARRRVAPVHLPACLTAFLPGFCWPCAPRPFRPFRCTAKPATASAGSVGTMCAARRGPRACPPASPLPAPRVRAATGAGSARDGFRPRPRATHGDTRSRPLAPSGGCRGPAAGRGAAAACTAGRGAGPPLCKPLQVACDSFAAPRRRRAPCPWPWPPAARRPPPAARRPPPAARRPPPAARRPPPAARRPPPAARRPPPAARRPPPAARRPPPAALRPPPAARRPPPAARHAATPARVTRGF